MSLTWIWGWTWGVAQLVHRYITSNVQKHEQKTSLVLKRYHWRGSCQPRCQRVSSPEWSRRPWIKSRFSKHQLLSLNVMKCCRVHDEFQVKNPGLFAGQQLDALRALKWQEFIWMKSCGQFMVNHPRIDVRKDCNYLRLTLANKTHKTVTWSYWNRL